MVEAKEDGAALIHGNLAVAHSTCGVRFVLAAIRHNTHVPIGRHWAVIPALRVNYTERVRIFYAVAVVRARDLSGVSLSTGTWFSELRARTLCTGVFPFPLSGHGAHSPRQRCSCFLQCKSSFKVVLFLHSAATASIRYQMTWSVSRSGGVARPAGCPGGAIAMHALRQALQAVQFCINSSARQKQTWFIKGINLRLSRGPLIITGGQSAGLPAGWTTVTIQIP